LNETPGTYEFSEFPDAGALIEAVLLASARPLSVETLAAAALLSTEEVEAAFPALEERYSPSRSGIVLRRVAGGYQLATNPACSEAVERLRGESRPAALSGAATETLAAVLYFGPLTRSAVSAARGVNSDAVVRSLVDRGLLAEVGSDTAAPGTPATLDVTERLLVAAGASSREDFPDLESLVDQEELDRVREKVAGPSETPEPIDAPESAEE
jgi:segregation and condensation protein B